MSEDKKELTRRNLLRASVRGACVVGLGGTMAALAGRSAGQEMVWQLDPSKCTWCGKCATNCVLEISAVKCLQEFAMCGYCDKCFGYVNLQSDSSDASGGGATFIPEKLLCPTGALVRKFVEGIYFEYTVVEELCIGCAKCVAGCQEGNGSLYLQIRHDRCINCNECGIALACPAGAFRRVEASRPYLPNKARVDE